METRSRPGPDWRLHAMRGRIPLAASFGPAVGGLSHALHQLGHVFFDRQFPILGIVVRRTAVPARRRTLRVHFGSSLDLTNWLVGGRLVGCRLFRDRLLFQGLLGNADPAKHFVKIDRSVAVKHWGGFGSFLRGLFGR